MKTIVSILSAVLLAGCASTPLEVATKEELAFESVSPPTIDVSGRWTGAWIDKRARVAERYTMALEQSGNTVSGQTVFADLKRSKATVRGQVSSNAIHLVMTPESRALHETSWRGVVVGRKVEGTWHLHGQPMSGQSTSGPWSGTRKR